MSAQFEGVTIVDTNFVCVYFGYTYSIQYSRFKNNMSLL